MIPHSIAYIPQTRHDSKRSAAVSISPQHDQTLAENTALVFCQVALGSAIDSTLFLKEGKDHREYFSRHKVSPDEKTWWQSLSKKSRDEQKFQARQRADNLIQRLTQHSDPRVRDAANRLAATLQAANGNGKSIARVKLVQQVRDDIEAFGQAILEARMGQARGMPPTTAFHPHEDLPQQSQVQFSPVDEDETLSNNDETHFSQPSEDETSLSDQSDDESSSFDQSEEESTASPLATSPVQIVPNQAQLPRCDIARFGSQAFTAADAAAMVKGLRNVPEGHAPYLTKGPDGLGIVVSHPVSDTQHRYDRAGFLQNVRAFAQSGLRHADPTIQRTAAKLWMYTDDCAHRYEDVMVNGTLLDALYAFAGIVPPATTAIPQIVFSSETTMAISKLMYDLPLNEVITLSVDEDDSLSIGTRPALPFPEDRQADHNFSQALGEIAALYLTDTDPTISRIAKKLMEQVESARAKGEGIIVTHELRHDLVMLAQRESEKPVDIQPTPVDSVPDSPKAPAVNAIGRVLPSGLADIPASAVQAIYHYARAAQNGSVLTLAVDSQDLRVDSLRSSSEPRQDADQPLEASFRQVVQQLAEFYAEDNDEDVRFFANQLKALSLDDEAHKNGIVVTPALLTCLRTLANFGNPERVTPTPV